MDDIQSLIEKCKYQSNKVQRSIMLDKINNIPFVHNLIFGQKIAHSVDDIYNTHHFYRYNEESSINKEIEWSIELIKFHSDELNRYLLYKSEYEQRLYKGDIVAAKNILEKINNITSSFWGIEQSFLLSDIEGGFKNNKIYLSKIGNSTSKSIILMISQFLSSKKSFSVDSKSYEILINNHYNQIKDELLKQYFKFKLSTKELALTLNDFKKILYVENLMTIIDIYETLLKILSYMISYNLSNSSINKSILINYISSISNGIIDSRLEHIQIFNNANYISKCKINVNYDFIKILELYSQGKYKECINCIGECFSVKELNFDIIEIFVKCITYLNETEYLDLCTFNVLKENLVIPMQHIVSCRNKEENLIILESTNKIFDNTFFYGQLYYFINRHYDNHKLSSIREISSYFSNVINPKSIISIKSKTIRKNIIERIFENSKNTTYFIYKSYLYNNYSYLEDCIIPEKNKDYLIARIEKDLATREILLLTILNSVDGNKINILLKEKIITCLFYTYLNQNKIADCIRLVVDSYIFNNNLITRMVFDDIKTMIKKINIYEVDDLYKAIFIYIYDKSENSKIYISIANYLDHYDTNIASELFSRKNFMINEITEFALFKLYTNEIMKRIVFILPDQRNHERMTVLNYLKATPFRETDEYDNEIEQILRDESIRNRIIQVEQTKIFVDTISLLKENEIFYKQSFQNFISLDNPELDYANISNLESEEEILTKKIKTIIKSDKVSQKYLVFREIYSNLLTSFLFDYKYGLEKFLSSRIRHGHLENNLLRSIKNCNLLSESTKDHPNLFSENTYWLNQINKRNSENEELKRDTIGFLSEFSIKIIEKVKEVKEWLSVYDENHLNGLFNYNLYFSEEVIKAIFVTYQDSYDFTIFYDDLINLIWTITNNILSDIKIKFDTELFSYFYSSLDLLYNQVEGNISNCEFKKIFLSQVNLCKSNIRSDIDIIINWLNVRKSNDFIDFTFFDAVDACITMQEKLDPTISKVSIKKINEADIVLNGEFFNYFFDLVNILLSNALLHSGYKNKNQMGIEIKATTVSWIDACNYIYSSSPKFVKDWKRLTSEDSSIPMIIEVKNKLNKTVNVELIHTKLNEILQRLKNIDVSKEFIFKEGNSGIIKINSILKYNILSPCYNIFYDIDEKDFTIQATIVIDIIKIARQGNKE